MRIRASGRVELVVFGRPCGLMCFISSNSLVDRITDLLVFNPMNGVPSGQAGAEQLMVWVVRSVAAPDARSKPPVITAMPIAASKDRRLSVCCGGAKRPVFDTRDPNGEVERRCPEPRRSSEFEMRHRPRASARGALATGCGSQLESAGSTTGCQTIYSCRAAMSSPLLDSAEDQARVGLRSE